MNLEDRIADVLAAFPGLKAREIADRLGVPRGEVNSSLYRHRGTRFVQDNTYRWRVLHAAAPEVERPAPAPSPPPSPPTPLTRLCRYYLDCISQEGELDISVFATGWYGLDYAELDRLPLLAQDTNVFQSQGAQRLLHKLRHDRSRLVLYLGYPVRLRHLRGRDGWEGYKVEPVCVWNYQERPDAPGGIPEIADQLPVFNFAVLRSLATVGSFLEEAIQLGEDLGIASAESEPPELDELFDRLHSVRPEWDWRECPDPYALSDRPPLAEIIQQGIYNRAVVLIGERSPYTQGLETELAKLAKLAPSQYSTTALGDWLVGRPSSLPEAPQEPLLEVLPLNSEQRNAVTGGLTRALTVITGPPGTGKSQVVTSLLVNAAWRNKKVLFASKNNKAVDVVEVRCNNLGPRPVLLRLGASEYQTKLAEYLDSLLAATATPADRARYEERLVVHRNLCERGQDLEAAWQTLIGLRNTADCLEQKVESHRRLFGDHGFSELRHLDLAGFSSAASDLCRYVGLLCPTSHTLLGRIVRPLLKLKYRRRLTEALQSVAHVLPGIGLAPPPQGPADLYPASWRAFATDLVRRFQAGIEVTEYYRALDQLNNTASTESLAASQTQLLSDLTENSLELWKCWLRLQPSRLSPEQRQQLGRYVALLRMIISGAQHHAALDRHVYQEYHRIFPYISNSLSCWAVTSLSARGRLPLEPGFFDLVVIDEASQCDIASALPLLYRAKAAVIIGDPKQLRHITTVTQLQDRQLIERHGLLGERENWAYSVNSLFDLARTLCTAEDLTNLLDHHRSHPDIIRFSNEQFYEGSLRVATRFDRLRRPGGPVVRWVEVQGEVVRPPGGAALNEQEARTVVQELRRLVIEQRYAGSIGVVSPFLSHANRIRDLIEQDDTLHQALLANEFLVHTVHRFQGDERDVMIFSPVVSTGIADSALGFLRSNGNLFNVAITRARSALIAVGNRTFALRCGVDYLARFAEYATAYRPETEPQPPAEGDLGPVYPPVSRPELVSPWEIVFYQALYAAGLRPIPQYSVEQYILDFALLAGARRLNIEVDGEHYHRNWDGELCRRDQIRNQRLIELGWDVMRFWVYQIRDDLPACVERVKRWAVRAATVA
jgi:very-short-patch-repair endonuclease